MSGERELITRFAQELIFYLKSRPDVDLESIDHVTPEMDFDLGTARVDKKIHDRSGDKIFIPEMTGVAYIRTRLTGAKYKLRVGNISLPFKELYLTNTAQAGKSLKLIIGYGAFVDFVSSNWGVLNTISGKDFATQATLASIKAKTDNLDVALSTKAKEAGGNLALIKAKTDNLDVALSTKAKEAGGNLALIKAKTDNLDVALSTKASENTLVIVKNTVAKLDIFLSELRDAITGVVGAKTLLDVVNVIEELAEKIEIQASSFNQKVAVNVGTSTTLILALNTNRKGFYIRNNGDNIIYLGNATVGTGNGLPFFPGNIFSEEDLPVTAAIYGVVVAATEEVRIVEET